MDPSPPPTRPDASAPILQVAAIPYRVAQRRLEVAIITSRDGRRWLVPKGHVEPDLGPLASAALEAFEEAGVEGTVHPRPLGSFEYLKRGVGRHVDVFAMAVTHCHDVWPERATRTRVWVSVHEAATRMHYRPLAECLDGLRLMVPTGAVA